MIGVFTLSMMMQNTSVGDQVADAALLFCVIQNGAHVAELDKARNGFDKGRLTKHIKGCVEKQGAAIKRVNIILDEYIAKKDPNIIDTYQNCKERYTTEIDGVSLVDHQLTELCIETNRK